MLGEPNDNHSSSLAEVLQAAQVAGEVLGHRAERPRRRHLLSGTHFKSINQNQQWAQPPIGGACELIRKSACLVATDTPDSIPPRVFPEGAQGQAGELGPQADHRRLVPGVGE